MITVRIAIAGKDRRVGAMVKALAVEVAGFQAVKGTTKEFLKAHGYYEFHFEYAHQAEDFRATVAKYLSADLASVTDSEP